MKRRVKQTVLLIMLSLACGAGLRAQVPDVVTLTPTDDPLAVLPLGGALSMYVDTLNDRTLHSIGAAPFNPVGKAIPNAGYTSEKNRARPIWIRFRVQNVTGRPVPLLVRVNFWCFESVQLFITRTGPVSDTLPGLVVASPVLGWRTPVAARPVHNRHFFFPFTMPVGAKYTLYLRVLKVRGRR